MSLREGNSKPALLSEARTRSRASWMARSVRPTMVKLGRPLATKGLPRAPHADPGAHLEESGMRPAERVAVRMTVPYRTGVKVKVHGQGTAAWPGFGPASTAS